MMRTTGTARMTNRTQAVDHLQHPSTTRRPILILGLFRGFRAQAQKGPLVPLAAHRCRVHGGLPQGEDHELSITSQPVHRSKNRPVRVISRPHAVLRPCPLYPRKRTFSEYQVSAATSAAACGQARAIHSISAVCASDFFVSSHVFVIVNIETMRMLAPPETKRSVEDGGLLNTRWRQ